jgi:sec-independent protein translocase protein TatC
MAAGNAVPLSLPEPDFTNLYDRLSGGQSLLAKLDELRRRITYCCVAIAVATLVSFTYIQQIVDFIFRPMRSVLPEGSKFIYTQPGEAFSIYVQIALIAGVVFSSPFIMYQVWRFIAPALYVGAKRFALPFVLLTTVGFVAGAAFNHWVAFKLMIAFFGTFNSSSLAFWPRLDDTFDLYVKMLFLMGLVFQMPALVFFLSKLGLVSARFLLRNFKYAVLVIFIIAAVVTPTGDPFNQSVFAVPMIGLYLLSILIAWIFAPVRAPLDERLEE